MRIVVQACDFDAGALLEAMRDGRRDIGALVSFTGIVRDTAGDLLDMTLEHYPGMTETALEEIAARAVETFGLLDALIVHRFGTMKPGEQIMMVAASAPHRQAAFDGANYMMDFLKSRAPFWKSERRVDGARWVAARDDDEIARDRWSARS